MLLDEFNELSAKFAEPMRRRRDERAAREAGRSSRTRSTRRTRWEIDRTARRRHGGAALPAGRRGRRRRSRAVRSGAWRSVACLLSKPDMLLLDEPTNHLDAESVAWLERFLQEYPGTVVAITHDRYFLDNVAGWILELDRGRRAFRGRATTPPGSNRRTSVSRSRRSRLARERARSTRELEWIKMSPRARQAKGKARINAFEELVKQGGERSRRRRSKSRSPFRSVWGTRSSSTPMACARPLARSCSIEDLTSFKLPPGGIVGIIGANGAGKTTLFKMISGEEKADAGDLTAR